MIEYKGKYTSARVMIDQIDQTTAGQITQFISHEAFTNPVAIMPDTHAGKGSVIGFTMELGDKVIPNTIGVDIGCGMLSFRVGSSFLSRMRKDQVDREIRKVVPFGTKVRQGKSPHFNKEEFNREVRRRLIDMELAFQDRFGIYIHKFEKYPGDITYLEDSCDRVGMDYDRCVKSIGTLGGGNHFIEVGKSEETGEYWVTIHCGSRNYGKTVADYHQKKAVQKVREPKMPKSEYVDFVKENFPKKKWQTEISKYEQYMVGDTRLPKGTEYLTELDMFEYLCDMVIAQTYAEFNRKVIMEHILDVMGVSCREAIETTHNFIDFEDWIIRKGAIRSYKDEKMIIPFNMEDGLLICEGKSNPEWNYSAPHGAGRVFSRSAAKKKLNLNKAKESMKSKGIYSSSIPLDECKEAYKDSSVIEECIEPTATIVERVKPVLNMKDS